jgi:hypothetical protein
MPLFHRKKGTLENTEKSLRNLQVSEETEKNQEEPRQEAKSFILNRSRKRFDLSQEEADWLLENVYKERNADKEVLDLLLEVLRKQAVQVVAPRSEPRSLESSDLFS